MMYGQLCTEFYDADKKFASLEELQWYQELFSKNDRILEPMCGSGRLLIPLLQLGYNVQGLDNSASMLESCKKRAQGLSLKPVLYQNSIENFPLDNHYEGIIIPLGSFQLIYPREKAYQALEKFKCLLAPGGKLILDLFIPWEVMHEQGEISNSTNKVGLPTGEWIEISSHTIANKFEQHMHSKTSYTKYSGKNIIEKEHEQMDILWYYPYEMELMLEKYGFKVMKRTNRFLNGSDHITFVATLVENSNLDKVDDYA